MTVLPDGHPVPSTPGTRPLRVARVVLAFFFVGVALAGCQAESDATLDFLAETDGTTYDGVSVGEERIDELRRDIEEYREAVQETTRRYGRIASFQKMLARELMEAEMYGPALEALEAAMELQTENAVLYYLAGVSAARSARAGLIQGEVEQRLDEAEQMYREALAIRPDYREALYGLTVLLAFERDRADDALEYARELARQETGDPSVRFLLANVLVRVGNVDEAREVYAELAQNAPSSEQRRRAAENVEALGNEG
ncbi:MAG: tetratricopeptide repeat protein [Alkalispirochaeta sp.]